MNIDPFVDWLMRLTGGERQAWLAKLRDCPIMGRYYPRVHWACAQRA